MVGVRLHGERAERQMISDLRVRHPGGDQRDDLAFPLGQHVQQAGGRPGTGVVQ
jgi:hypothetical protein